MIIITSLCLKTENKLISFILTKINSFIIVSTTNRWVLKFRTTWKLALRVRYIANECSHRGVVCLTKWMVLKSRQHILVILWCTARIGVYDSEKHNNAHNLHVDGITSTLRARIKTKFRRLLQLHKHSKNSGRTRFLQNIIN